jgi:hypothetical protein
VIFRGYLFERERKFFMRVRDYFFLFLLPIFSLIFLNCAETRAYKSVISQNNYAQYQRFVLDYPKSEHLQDIADRMNQLEREKYETAKRIDSVAGYREFYDKFPNSKLAPDVKSRIEYLQYRKSVADDQVGEYRQFLGQYPKSKFIADVHSRLKRLEEKSLNSMATVADYDSFVSLFPDSARMAEANRKKDAILSAAAAEERRVKEEAAIARDKKRSECLANGHMSPNSKIDTAMAKIFAIWGQKNCAVKFLSGSGEVYKIVTAILSNDSIENILVFFDEVNQGFASAKWRPEVDVFFRRAFNCGESVDYIGYQSLIGCGIMGEGSLEKTIETLWRQYSSGGRVFLFQVYENLFQGMPPTMIEDMVNFSYCMYS